MIRSRYAAITLAIALTGLSPASAAFASGGSGGGGGGGAGGGGTSVGDSISVSKCYINAAGEMLIKASSSNSNATLLAYRPDGTLIGTVQNGGGSRYGGTVMPYQSYDPVNVTIVSSAGGRTTVPTTAFVL